MPRVTNARASIDYDWDGAPAKNTGTRSNNGAHNWAAADNGWVFWATRVRYETLPSQRLHLCNLCNVLGAGY
jgi:hypothetical protein